MNKNNPFNCPAYLQADSAIAAAVYYKGRPRVRMRKYRKALRRMDNAVHLVAKRLRAEEV